MEITEVRIKLMEEAGERLQAFCSITFDDCFVIRDLKIIEGTSGAFVAMPSRKLTAHCPQCRCKNHLRASYCNQCGLRLKEDRAAKDEDGRAKLYADIAHPINSTCREMIQERVIQAYYDELERSHQPGYISSYDDYDEDVTATPHHGSSRRSHERHQPAAQHDGAVRRESATGDQTKVEPAESTPRGPHKMVGHPKTPLPTPLPHTTHNTVEAAKHDGFGAGIF